MRSSVARRLGLPAAGLPLDRSTDGLVLDKARFWRGHAGVSLTDRQQKVINRLLDAGRNGFEGGLTTRKYVGMTGASRATAFREIDDLLTRGILVRRSGGGRSASYDLRWDRV